MSTTTTPPNARAATGDSAPAGVNTAGSGRLRRTLAQRWPTALGATATVASLALVTPLPQTAQTLVSAWGILTAAVIYLTWGTARGELGDRRLLTAQTAAVLGFGAVALAAVAASLLMLRA